MARLEGGALDFVNYPQTSDALRLNKDPKYQILPAYNLGFIYAIWINVAEAPFDRKEVRQAMNYALDRQRFVDTTLGGLVGPPRDLPWPPRSPASEPSKNTTYTFDLNKASSLLKTAGVANFTAELNYVTAGQSGVHTARANLSSRPGQDRRRSQHPADGQRYLVKYRPKSSVQGHGDWHASGFGGQDATSGLQTGASARPTRSRTSRAIRTPNWSNRPVLRRLPTSESSCIHRSTTSFWTNLSPCPLARSWPCLLPRQTSTALPGRRLVLGGRF